MYRKAADFGAVSSSTATPVCPVFSLQIHCAPKGWNDLQRNEGRGTNDPMVASGSLAASPHLRNLGVVCLRRSICALTI